jgi:hypothetical protein
LKDKFDCEKSDAAIGPPALDRIRVEQTWNGSKGDLWPLRACWNVRLDPYPVRILITKMSQVNLIGNLVEGMEK